MEPARDEAAFCADVQRRLLGSMVLYCGDRMLAEEITQEALVRALERWSRVSRMASPEAWVYKTALNLARSTFHRRLLERRANARTLQHAGVASLPTAPTPSPCGRPWLRFLRGSEPRSWRGTSQGLTSQKQRRRSDAPRERSRP